jgi:cytochrome bd ubiquinol oxidase subunit I
VQPVTRRVYSGAMDHVFAARAQMGTSLAFHIVFAALGVGLPLLVCIAEGLWLRTNERAYYDLARTWSKGMAILFAVGAVSGTILSFELGLLWPAFMKAAGALIGLPFSLEGFAFFIEAIFIGIYLYSWDKLSPRAHWLTIFPVIISGTASAAFVTLVNAWMQMPTGFRLVNGVPTDVQPYVAMFALPWKTEVAHTTLAAFVLTGFGAAAVCAFACVRGDRRPNVTAGLRTAMIVAAIAIPLQIVVGDIIARFDADNEPAKFAAMETLEHTQRYAPISIGGFPTADGNIVHPIEIPDALSFLVAYNPSAEVRGLDSVAPNDRPPVAATHLSFDAMVGSGSLLLLIAAVWAYFTLRKRTLPRFVLIAIAISGPLALIALEAGWFVTEFGRQPWIVHGLLRTADAVTTSPDLDARFFGFSLIYVVLAATCWWLLRRVGRSHAGTHG